MLESSEELKIKKRGAWLAPLEEEATLDLPVVIWSPRLGAQIT